MSEVTIRKQNYLSDFSMLVERPLEIGMPWRMEFYTDSPNSPYVVQYNGTEYVNCRAIGDYNVEVFFNAHGFAPGYLMMALSYRFTDTNFADGYRDVERTIKLPLMLTAGETEADMEEVILLRNYINGKSAYELAVENGYEGTSREYALDPIEAAATAYKAASGADASAASATSAAELALSAAASMGDAVANAQLAAAAANEAAGSVTEVLEDAAAAAFDANSAGRFARLATENAKDATDDAVAATSDALAAAATATSATNAAAAAASSATEKANLANAAANNANTAMLDTNTATNNANAAAAAATSAAGSVGSVIIIAEEKIADATTATSNANSATSAANTAATNAEAKAGLANTATVAANTAKDAANTAASNADAKATLANAKATLANTAAGVANTAAETANTAASNADTKASLANTAAGTANTAAETANTAAGTANTAASNADTKAVLANNAALSADTATEAALAAAAQVNDKANVSQLTERNYSAEYPKSGVDGTDQYTLQGVLNLINAQVGAAQIKQGHVVAFKDKNCNGSTAKWEFKGGDVVASNWLDVTNRNTNERLDVLEACDFAEERLAYGIEWKLFVSSPICTRIGNTALHVALPIQSKVRRCLLTDNGIVNYYLHDGDSTKKADGSPAVLDGTDGMVMVEIPAHYRRFSLVDSDTNRALISEYPIAGYHYVPKTYRSAYEATTDRTAASIKLASVVNLTAAFRGGNNNAAWDGTYRTLLGVPASSISLTNFRAYARNRGEAGKNGKGWNCDVYEVQKNCYWLYCIEYANFNSQATYNAEPDANGYKQGGLGAGVTTLASAAWGAYNSYYAFVPCGHTNSLGNRTGVIDFAMPDEYGTALTVGVPSYRGLENPFGHLWSWTDGCKCNIQSADDGGISEFYTCEDPANFQSTDYTNYVKRGELPRTEGYVRTMMVGEYGENMPIQVGGGSSTYFCDYFYTNVVSNTGQRGVLFGGDANNGALVGLSYAYANNVASHTTAIFGSRLCFIPE